MYINERNIILLYCHYVTDLFTMFRNTIVHVYNLHHCTFVNLPFQPCAAGRSLYTNK